MIASDFALLGYTKRESVQIVASIRDQLKQRDWKAGSFNVGFRSCDDTTVATKAWSIGQCLQNGETYAADLQIVGVIGTYNSGCAGLMLPSLSRVSIPMVSPVNTYLCLSRQGAACDKGETQSYQPQEEGLLPRQRGRPRAVGRDRTARTASCMQSASSCSTTVTHTAQSFAAMTTRVLKLLQIPTSRLSWNPKAQSCAPLWQKVGTTHPDLVILAGLLTDNGGSADQGQGCRPRAEHRPGQAPRSRTTMPSRETIAAVGKAASKGMLATRPAGELSDDRTHRGEGPPREDGIHRRRSR